MSDSERAQHIKDKIRRHLGEVGASGWKVVRTECPEISDATFWRYVKAVREEGNKDRAHEPVTGPAPTPDEGFPHLGALPAFYNPLQKARLYEALLADAEALRAHAVDRRGKITDARLFEKSILLRERLIAEQAQMMNLFQDQEAIDSFFKQIFEMVSNLPKEFAHEFIEKMEAAQRQCLTKAHV
jgi:hypothetical protein